jgi:hypothetical protein
MNTKISLAWLRDLLTAIVADSYLDARYKSGVDDWVTWQGASREWRLPADVSDKRRGSVRGLTKTSRQTRSKQG